MSDQKSQPAFNIILGAMDFGRYVPAKDAPEMVEMFLKAGFREVDTAIMYNGGKSERILSAIPDCRSKKVSLASKANPRMGLSYEGVIEQCNKSLKNLNVKSLDLFYLHMPDHTVAIEETLRAVNDLHKEGKFLRFGLSNYASWQVVQIYYICKSNGWILPSVYQGMYSAITREVERELLPALRALGMKFYAYSPLGGGFLSGKHTFESAEKLDSQDPGRFFGNSWASIYRSRYWFRDNFDVLDKIKALLNTHYGNEVSCAEASLRWIVHHSALKAEHGDGLIVGSSKIHHLEANLKAITGGPLHEDVVAAFEELWKVGAHHCPSYFR